MNKKLITLLLPILLVGCNVDGNTNNGNGNSGTSSSEVVKTYNITIKENPNCKISVSKAKASRNEVIEVSVTDIKEGYAIDKITANGNKIANSQFVMPNEDVEIEVFLKNLNNPDGINSVEVKANEFALIWVEQESYNTGDNVEIAYQCKGNYILDYFTVNGEAIEGTSFKMPDGDVVIDGVFKLVFSETPWQVTTFSGGIAARSFWYMNYGEAGLEVTVKVDDRRICDVNYQPNAVKRDGIEFILAAKTDYKGWPFNESYKVLVTCDEDAIFNSASAANTWGGDNLAFDYIEEEFNYSVEHKYLSQNDGYDGYEVNVFIAYEVIGLTKEEALNNVSVCPSLRNSNAHRHSNWSSLPNAIWQDCSTHPILLEDGSYEERS